MPFPSPPARLTLQPARRLQTAEAAWRLKVAKRWAPNLTNWLAQFGAPRLVSDLSAPQGIQASWAGSA